MASDSEVLDLVINSIHSSAEPVSAAYKALGPALKMWRLFEERRIKSLLKGVSTRIGDEAALEAKLQDAFRKPATVELVSALMEKVRRAESVWATYCLGILLGKTLNDEVMEIQDLIFADILSRLDDNDLNFLCRLHTFVASTRVNHDKEWQIEKSQLLGALSELEDFAANNNSAASDPDFITRLTDAQAQVRSHEFKKVPSLRIEEADLKEIEFAKQDGLLLTRMRVDRLTFSGVFSGDIGGWGGTGLAHGNFVWHDATEAFYQFILFNKPD